MAGHTFHGRKGEINNAFRYSVDYFLLDPEKDTKGPFLFSRNRRNVTSIYDIDHGGEPGAGMGPEWARSVLAEYGVAEKVAELRLLAQPRFWGHVFNPVSFWLAFDHAGALICVIPEVTNTYGERHSYICLHDDHREIKPSDKLTAKKIFYVSPFQPIAGGYEFRFDIRPEKIGIWINFDAGSHGLMTNLTGTPQNATNMSILKALFRRPLGSRRVLGLIHWQAFKLWWKGAKFRSRPTPPHQEVSR